MSARQPIEPGSKEYRRRACERKRRYQDQVSALAFAISEMERTQGLKLDTYKCRFCGGWHLFRVQPGNSQRLFRARQSETA